MDSLAVALLSTALAGAAPPEAGFAKLSAPQAGDWRVQFPEPEQSFEEYKRRSGRALPFGKRTIRLLPFGEERDGDPQRLSGLKDFLAAYFMTRVELDERRSVPDDVPRRSMRGFGKQILADKALKLVSRRLPDRTVARLALCSDDLYAKLPGRFAWRYRGEPPDATPRKRLFKLAAHELGHVFGLAHCQTYHCLMNGSNSLKESDRAPVHLCPDCLKKLSHHLGFEKALRYRTLEKHYRKLGWKSEAEFAAKRALIEAGSALRRPAGAPSGGGGERKDDR
jgi:archaemetzincin